MTVMLFAIKIDFSVVKAVVQGYSTTGASYFVVAQLQSFMMNIFTS